MQELIREAGAVIVEVEHLLAIAGYFGALPDDVVLIEFEPVSVEGGEELSPVGAAALPRLLAMAREAALAPPAEGDRRAIGRAAERAVRWPGITATEVRAG